MDDGAERLFVGEEHRILVLVDFTQALPLDFRCGFLANFGAVLLHFAKRCCVGREFRVTPLPVLEFFPG